MTTIEYLIGQVITLLVVGIMIFFKGFLNKKGENLATKQDIQEITGLIENVKSENEKNLLDYKISKVTESKEQEFIGKLKTEILDKAGTCLGKLSGGRINLDDMEMIRKDIEIIYQKTSGYNRWFEDPWYIFIVGLALAKEFIDTFQDFAEKERAHILQFGEDLKKGITTSEGYQQFSMNVVDLSKVREVCHYCDSILLYIKEGKRAEICLSDGTVLKWPLFK